MVRLVPLLLSAVEIDRQAVWQRPDYGLGVSVITIDMIDNMFGPHQRQWTCRKSL